MPTPKKIGQHAQVSYRMVDPKELVLNPNNQRDYDAQDPDMVSLRQSLASQRVLTALEIYDDGVVHDGNRRLFNINILMGEGAWEGPVPAIIVPRPENEVEATIARLNKNEARQFGPLEQARAFAVLREGGLNNSQIAAKTPFTSMHVGNMLVLHDASEAIRSAVKARQISATLVVETLRNNGEDVVMEAVAMALEQGRDRATQRHIDAVLASKAPPAPAPAPVADATPVVDAPVADATPVTDVPFDLDATPPAAPVIATEQPITVPDATPDATPAPTTGSATPDATPAEAPVADATPDADAAPDATPAPTTGSVTAKTAITLIAPTIRDLLMVLANGTNKEKLEALAQAQDELEAFMQNAKKLNALGD